MHVCIYACMCICVCVSTWVRGTWNEPEIPYLLVLLMRRVRKGRLGWAVLCRAVSGQGGDDDDTSLLSEEYFFFLASSFPPLTKRKLALTYQLGNSPVALDIRMRAAV